MELSKTIKHNPFILPVLFTQNREHWSSVKIWNDIKERLGDDIWVYLKKIKRRSDAVGVRYLQRTLKSMYNEFRNELLKQVIIEYNPLFIDKYVTAIFILDFKDDSSLINFVKEISKRCMVLYVYPPQSNHKKVMIYVITSHSEIHDIITDIAGNYGVERILWKSKMKFEQTWGRNLAKFKYENIFDPVKCEWV